MTSASDETEPTAAEAAPAGRPGASILVVDDEPNVCQVLVDYLSAEGHTVRSAGDGKAALAAIAAAPVDLIVLDLMMPEVDGFEVLRRIREQRLTAAVIVLSARNTEPDLLNGLDLGADDYVTKPASPREIVARVRAVLRRTAPVAAEPIESGPVRLDPRARTVAVNGEPVDLPPREFDLLLHLMQHPRQAFSRADLLGAVWGSSADWQDPATVTVHARRLRGRIEADPAEPAHLVTVYGVGYRWEP